MAGHPGHPEAARAALADTRLREPAPGHRHHPGQAAGARRQSWEDLRETAVAVKQRACVTSTALSCGWKRR
ncbi:hypothetical protein OG542_07385 [Streptomyces violaceus]|uniref:hypothetical protein n=1 Tax=Streptomyces violaceus TaxID=1936 RepID=UPI002E1B8D2E